MASLLVTNDFPPKIGGIQSYLYELWRRLPPEAVTVLTTPYQGAAAFDAAEAFRIDRTREQVLFPTRRLGERIVQLARDSAAGVVFLDPMLPLGAVNVRLQEVPTVVIVHGAEVTVPGRLPGSRQLARRVLDRAHGIVAAGGYPAAEAARAAGRPLPTLVIPPGVDTHRFTPEAAEGERAAVRQRYGLALDRPVVLGLSRLVPRKGFDVLIDAVAHFDGAVQLAIAGSGRDRSRLAARAARRGVAVRLLGRVDDADLPALYRSADLFAMLCRDRWAGLEAEGFGIVFLEAAACGIPQLAGRSGGAHEAVVDGETGFVVDPRSVGDVIRVLARILGDDEQRVRMGEAARLRVETDYSYDVLAARLRPLAEGDLSVLETQ